jgi:HEAT repeat protein
MKSANTTLRFAAAIAALLAIGLLVFVFIGPLAFPGFVIKTTPSLPHALATYGKSEDKFWCSDILFERLVHADISTQEEILRLLGSKDANTRIGAVHAIGLLKIERAVAQVAVVASGDPSVLARRNAIIALNTIGTQECIPPIVAATTDPDSWTRMVAVNVASKFASKVDRSVFINRLNDTDRLVRNSAIKALDQYDIGDVANSVASLLNDSEDSTREMAVRLLGKHLDRAEIREKIEGKLKDENGSVRRAAEEILTGIKKTRRHGE